MKTFFVITETCHDWENTVFSVLHAFDDWEEADKVLTLLQEEDRANEYDYELVTVKNDHAFPGTLEEERMKIKAKENTKELEKKQKQEKLEQAIQKKKQREKEAEIASYKEKIDAFTDWLFQKRDFISLNEIMKDNHDEQAYVIVEEFLSEAYSKRKSFTPVFQAYLIEHHDEKILELLEKPIEDLLQIPKPDKLMTEKSFIPRRLRDLMKK